MSKTALQPTPIICKAVLLACTGPLSERKFESQYSYGQKLKFVFIHFTGSMAVKKIECPLCDISYKSKFCASLHLHVHQQQSKVSTGLQCSLCKKQFVMLDHFKNHLQCHLYSCPVKSSGEVMKKTGSK